MDLLNLDDIVQATQAVSIKGVDYPVNKRTVGQMIVALKAVRELEENNEKSDMDKMEDMFNSMLSAAQEILPKCPVAVLRTLTMEQLNALVDFANKSDQQPKEDAVEEEASEKT